MKKLFLLYVTVISLSNIALSQWEPCNNGLNGGMMSCIAIEGTEIFLGSKNDGLFYSSDNGVSWTKQSNGLHDPLNTGSPISINCLFVSGDNVIAGTTKHGLFYSTDKGKSWAQTTDIYGTRAVNDLTSSSGTIFAGTDDGIYFSTNFGKNWKNAFKLSSVMAIISDGNKMYAASSTSGLYMSTNEGIDWVSKNSNFTTINKFAFSDSTVVAGSSDGYIVFYSDYGNTSHSNDSGLGKGNCFNSIAIKDSFLIVGTCVKGVYISTDLGNNWLQKNNGIEDLEINSVAISSSYLYAVTNSGLFISTDKGENWTASNNGITDLGINSIIKIDNTIFAGTGYNGIFKSTNLGNNWAATNGGLTSYNNKCLISLGENIFAGGESLFISTDAGLNWKNDNISSCGTIYSMATADNKIYVGSSSERIFLSEDTAKNWKQIMSTTDIFSFSSVTGIEIIDSLIIAGLFDKGIVVSKDKGLTWDIKNEGISNNNIIMLKKFGNKLYAGGLDGFYVSTDYGETWIKQTEKVISELIPYAMIKEDKLLVIGNYFGGIFISSDEGKSWVSKNNGIDSTSCVNSLYHAGEYLYAGTGHGMFRVKLTDFISGIKDEMTQYDYITVSPNPASNFIYLNNGASSLVKGKSIEIYTPLGIKIPPFHFDSIDGREQIKIDISGLAPGVYFVRVEDRICRFIKI